MLERDRAHVSERRASMQGDERESMLERDRVRVSERRASMQGEERESMLERDRARVSERHSAQQYSESQLPLLQQQRVVHKLASFHEKVGDCQFHSCNTCHEFFPSLKVSSSSGECSRCSRDKHQPKLYSHA